MIIKNILYFLYYIIILVILIDLQGHYELGGQVIDIMYF